MKPILCIDVTLDKKNEQFIGDEFITASTPKEIMDKHLGYLILMFCQALWLLY